MIKIGLIRHGCTDWNKEGRAQGHSDIPLCEEGIEQARKLAERLEHEKWDVIYSSDLGRAAKTAVAIANKKGIELNLDTRLRERHGGQIEGTTEAERINKWGDNWRDLDLGVEPRSEITERGMAGIKDMMKEHPNQNILIVSHGAFIKQLLRTWFPGQDMEASLGNCSITVVETDGNEWNLALHNCVVHI